jgi:hypothetical protein
LCQAKERRVSKAMRDVEEGDHDVGEAERRYKTVARKLQQARGTLEAATRGSLVQENESARSFPGI